MEQIKWGQFTKWIPIDNSLVITKIRIPSSVIESWQVWLNERGCKTKIELRGNRRALFIMMNKIARRLKNE